MAVRRPPWLGLEGDARVENGVHTARRRHVWVGGVSVGVSGAPRAVHCRQTWACILLTPWATFGKVDFSGPLFLYL